MQEDALCTERPSGITSSAATAEGTYSRVLHAGGIGFRLEGEKRFRVSAAHREAEVVRRRQRVAVGLIGGVVTHLVECLIEPHRREAGILVVSVAVVDVRAQRHVAAVVAEAAEQLYLRAQVLVGTIAHTLVLPVVHDQVEIIHLTAPLLAQRVGDVVEGVGIERCRCLERTAVVGREAEVRSQR